MKTIPFTAVHSRDRAGGGAGGAFPTFLAVDVRTLNVQLEIFKETENEATLDADTNKI